MKINGNTTDKDLLCQSSLDLLTEGINRFFHTNFPNEACWVCDNSSEWVNYTNQKEIKHVVLFGNYLRSITEIAIWPGNELKIWVLSELVREIVCRLTSLEKNQIGVIPRSNILNLPKFTKELSTTFFYSGRISRQKNISELILTFYLLQKRYDRNYNLSLLGEFDDHYHYNLGRFLYKSSFKEVTSQLLKKLNFETTPIHIGNFKSDEWLNKVQDDSSFISLSTYYMEDFGMSIQQALNAGHSGVLTNWLGHNDLSHESAYFLDSNLIPRQDIPLVGKFYFCEKLAESIHNKNFTNGKLENLNAICSPPMTTTKEMRLEASAHFLQLASPLSALLARDQVSYFADTQYGKKLFAKIDEVLQSTKKTNRILLIYSSAFQGMELNEEIEIYSALKSKETSDNKFEFMSVHSLDKKFIFNADEVLITSKAKKEMSSNLKKIEEICGHVHLLAPLEIIPSEYKNIPDEF